MLIEISGHLIQFLILEGFVFERSLPETNIFKRDFKNFNEREFIENLHNMDWNNICNLNSNDPNLSCTIFFNAVTFLLDEAAPFKKVTKNEYRLMLKPWISKEILHKCKQRDVIFKQTANESDVVIINSLRTEYKRLRNEVTANKRSSKKAYYTAYFERNKQKSTDIWKGIRSLVNIKASKVSSLKLLTSNNNLISDPKVVSNIFINYFSSIGQSIDSRIPIVTGNYKDYFKKKDAHGKAYINPSDLSFFLSPTTPAEIEKLIDGLDIKKSTGPNSIPVYILKTLKPFFAFWLSKLINLSFVNGIFPEVLKMAKVTPLHKKECKLNFLNYRPISLLSVFSKLFEKVIYTQIYTYLVKNNLIYERQFGFRSNYSTNHALLSITERIKGLVDSGNYVCGVFVDLEKAFDTVNHTILCEKLKFYGFRGKLNNLIQSYLSDRNQYVSINGFESDIKRISCGVPQGSSLGPLLFLLYINDFRLCLNKTECGHFADDTFILFHSKSLGTIESIFNYELKFASKWLRLNRLSLNEKKTELIFFRSPQRSLNYDDISIKFNGKKLIPVDHVSTLECTSITIYHGIFIFCIWLKSLVELMGSYLN